MMTATSGLAGTADAVAGAVLVMRDVRCIAHRRERHGPEQAGRRDLPLTGVERLVVDVDEVDLLHDPPLDALAIEIADAIGGEVCDLDLEHVLSRLEVLADGDVERDAPER